MYFRLVLYEAINVKRLSGVSELSFVAVLRDGDVGEKVFEWSSEDKFCEEFVDY